MGPVQHALCGRMLTRSSALVAGTRKLLDVGGTRDVQQPVGQQKRLVPKAKGGPSQVRRPDGERCPEHARTLYAQRAGRRHKLVLLV